MKTILILSLLHAVSACSQAERAAQPLQASLLAQAASPANTRAETKVVNSIGMEFIAIPAGAFMLGAGDGDRDAYDSERLPQHQHRFSCSDDG